ncbi:MAG: PIG-L family deacetylase [Nitrospirae bacterium]|nr:PIG-L family deacetylase [Nitrospirota bacterium]
MKILALGAHIDDIELACGGTLSLAIERGNDVSMVVLSQSAYTSYDGRVIRTNDVAIEEGKNAAAILGITNLEIWDFPTKDIPYHSEVVERINQKVNDFKPDIIFTHWPFDTHKSHQNTALSSIAAARYYNTILMYDPIAPAGRSYVGFRPQVYVDISSHIDKKLNALKAHKSEYGKYGEKWIEGIKARAHYRGYEIGTTYAEAFEVLRFELKF